MDGDGDPILWSSGEPWRWEPEPEDNEDEDPTGLRNLDCGESPLPPSVITAVECAAATWSLLGVVPTFTAAASSRFIGMLVDLWRKLLRLTTAADGVSVRSSGIDPAF